jgi:hypothetical protein
MAIALLVHAAVKVAVFFPVERRGGGLTFQVSMIDQHSGEIRQHLGQPIGGSFFAEEQHILFATLSDSGHRGKSYRSPLNLLGVHR